MLDQRHCDGLISSYVLGYRMQPGHRAAAEFCRCLGLPSQFILVALLGLVFQEIADQCYMHARVLPVCCGFVMLNTSICLLQDYSSADKWEALFGSADFNTDVTLPAGRTVVLHGCAQSGNTVDVQSITVPAGTTVSAMNSTPTEKRSIFENRLQLYTCVSLDVYQVSYSQ